MTGVQTCALPIYLEVNEVRIQGTAVGKKDALGEERIRRDAVKDALEKANADVMVEPKFKSETAHGRTTVTVTGFGATYKNFHPIKADEVELMKAGVIQKAEVYHADSAKKKHGVGWIVAGIVGFAIILTLLTSVGVQ